MRFQIKASMIGMLLTVQCAISAHANSCRQVMESGGQIPETHSSPLRFGHRQKQIIAYSLGELARVSQTLTRRGVRSQVETLNGQTFLVITPGPESEMNRFAAKQLTEQNGLKIILSPLVFSIFADAGAAYQRNIEPFIPLNRNLNPDMAWLESGLPDHALILSRTQVENFDPTAPLILHEIDHAGLNQNLANKRPTVANIKGVSENETAQKFFYSGNYTAEEAFVVANDLIRARDALRKLSIKKFEGFAGEAEAPGGTTVTPTTQRQLNLFLLTYAHDGIRHASASVEAAKEAHESLFSGRHPEYITKNSITWAVLAIQSSASKRRYKLAIPLPDSQGSTDPKNASLLFSQLKLHQTVNQDLEVLFTWVYQTLRHLQADPNSRSAYSAFINLIQLPLRPHEPGYNAYSIEGLNKALSRSLN